MAAKKRKPTVDVYESRTLRFEQIAFWDDLQEAARRILEEKGIPKDALVDCRGTTIEVTGQW